MSRSVSCIVGFLALALLISPVAQAETPTFEQPVLVTCTGQTPGSLTMAALLKRVGVNAEHKPLVLPKEMTGYKTVVVVMGASLKGLGAAGLDQETEMERNHAVLEKAKSSGMKVILAHIEGQARRNAIADKFIIPFIPKADLLLVTQDGNEDGLFTRLSKEHGVPLILVKDYNELTNVLKQLFS